MEELFKESYLCPEIHYQIVTGGVIVTGCYGASKEIIFPDIIEGKQIVGIAPYGFSDDSGRRDKDKDMIWLSSYASHLPERRRLMKEEIEEIYLPKYVRDIGRYAFYRCRNLRKLSIHNRVLEIGGGALNGCISLREITVHLHDENGDMSALKSIASEVRYELHVTFVDQREDMDVKTYEILLPEHYEEAVENTPARILYTRHHGSGGYYRQCFLNRALDFQKYDEVFPFAIAEENDVSTVRLALFRLRFPKQLKESARKQYVNYVRDRLSVALPFVIEHEDKETIWFLSDNGFWTKELLEEAILIATEKKMTEILSYLMDERYRLFPKKRKRLEL